MKKKILIFAPYGTWIVHHQVDAILGAALRMMGCDVSVVCCDGIFKNCPISGNLSKDEVCKNCANTSLFLFTQFKLPIVYLSSLLNKLDYKKCKDWTNGLYPEEFHNDRLIIVNYSGRGDKDLPAIMRYVYGS